ncbi:MAG TPA: hypothetical protein VMF33_06400 [Acidimicrobiales bacterium]|nr:hypothetical protein [Acidimicrobiales bacterium]
MDVDEVAGLVDVLGDADVGAGELAEVDETDAVSLVAGESDLVWDLGAEVRLSFL